MSEATATLTETPVTLSEETRAEGQTDAAQVVETPEVIDTSAFDGEADEYLKGLTAGKEGETPAPESRRPTGPDPRAIEAGRNQLRQLHADKQAYLDSYETELVETGVVSPSMAKRLVKDAKDRLNELYAASIPLAGYEAQAQALETQQTAVRQAIADSLGKDFATFERQLEEMGGKMPNGVVPYREVFNTFADLKYKNYVSKADHESGLKEAFKQGRAQRALKGNSESSQGHGTNGSVNGGSVFKTKQENDRASYEGRITPAEWKANDDRLSQKGT